MKFRSDLPKVTYLVSAGTVLNPDLSVCLSEIFYTYKYYLVLVPFVIWGS